MSIRKVSDNGTFSALITIDIPIISYL